MFKAIKIRIYPNLLQQQAMACNFGCSRWVWNEALEQSRKLYLSTGKGLSYFGMTERLPGLKQNSPWLSEADSQALTASLRILASAFQGFFEKRSGYPRFKTKHGPQSYQYPQRVKCQGDRLYLPKVGWVKAVIHREIEGAIKTVTISKSSSGKYHASILLNDGLDSPAVSIEGKAIGIDLGLTDFAVTSDGSKFSNPRHIRKAEKNLKRKQQKLSRKKKGSNSRGKARMRVARAHERVANARRDYLHKLSNRIVSENQVIAVEDLNVKGMIKNHSLAKAISDAGWGAFTRFLEYKAAWHGKAFVRVGRFYPSSKACSVCGGVQASMPLKVRRWDCSGCGASHDRDVNAATNIRDEALRLMAAGIAVTASGGGISRKRGRKSSVHATAVEAGKRLALSNL